MKITCKRSFRFSFYRHIISCFLIVLLQVYTLKADHHALIIAIGDYPASSGWSSISSQNDVVHIVAALEIVGFKSDHIQIIRDQEATRDGILKSFDRFIKNIAKGDQVYVHYSGHGQQVIDDDLNEEIDQLDEAIVPFDSPLYFDLGKYEGENLIRDDELAQISKRIRKKLGATGQLIWVLDSCHSGTGLRGIGNARGTDVIMANKDYIHSATVLEKSMEEDEIGLENLAPLLSLFGSSPRELNFETLDQQSKPVGSLSYSISVVLAEMNNPYSFQEFYSRVQQKMKVYAPRQNPQWEGPENVVLFEGQLKATKNEFFQVVEKIDDTHYKIAAGSVSDVFEGATIRMFSSSQPEVFSLGKVINASFNKAIVEIDDQLNIDETELLMVSIIDRVSPAIQLIIRNDVPESQFWHQVIKTSLDKISFSESSTNPDLYFYVEDQNLRIDTKEGVSIVEIPYDLDKDLQVKTISTQIRSYLQTKFLRSFKTEDSNFEFQLAVEQIDCRTEKHVVLDQANGIKLKVGSCIKFKITNTGLVGGYYTLIDIQPDNIINLLIPAVQLNYTASEYYLKPGDQFVTSYAIEIAKPLGEETLKLICSKKPLEIADIIATQGNLKKGISQLNDFEQQFASSFHKSNETIIRKNTDELGVTTLYLSIVE